MKNQLEQYIITFDLLTDKYHEEKLKNEVHIPLSSMYDKIKTHMINNGFSWQQGSTYISNSKIDFTDFQRTIDKLFKKYKWLTEYVRDMTNGIIKDINLVNFNSIINRYKKQYNKEKNA